MTKAPVSLQELRKRIYIKAKADKTWRFWGLYVHVCKREVLQTAYEMAKQNDGAPGIDGVTFKLSKRWARKDSWRTYGTNCSRALIGQLVTERRKFQRGRQSPCPGDTDDSRPGGSGSAQAHSGADL